MNYQKANKKADQYSINAAAFQQNIMKNLNLPQLSLNRQQNIQQQNVINGLKGKNYKSHEDNQEQQIYYYNKKLTLAQKLGLVPAPEKPLTNEEWLKIEETSLKRNDVCPICIEPFKNKDQIILSCSHVFHQVCLNIFEKHNQKQQCPVCRKIDYQKKIHDKGFIKLANLSRIHNQKKSYGIIINPYKRKITICPFKVKQMIQRRRITMFKLSKIGTKITKTITQKQEKANKIMNQLNLRELNQNLEQNLKLLQKTSEKTNTIIQETVQKQLLKEQVEIDIKWIQIKQLFEKRNEKECPICLTEMNGDKAQYLLSCSHSFHVNCLNSFVWFSVQQNNQCPVCRAHYEKMFIVKK